MDTLRNVAREAMGTPQQVERILILASGPSAKVMDRTLIQHAQDRGVHVMCVNRALEWSPTADSFFTLDPDERVLPLLTHDHHAGVEYHVAVPEDYGRPNANVLYHRNVKLPPCVHFHLRVAGDGPRHCHYFLSQHRLEFHP